MGIVAGAIGVLLTGGAALGAIATAGSVAAAWSAASTTTLVVGGMGLLADATGIASGATEDSNPQASSVLGWVSMATGIAGMAAGLPIASKGAKTIMQVTEGTRQRLGNILETGLSGRGAPVAAKLWATANMDELSAIAFQGHISENKIFFLHKSPGQNNKYVLINSVNNNEKLVPDGKYLFVNRTDEPERIRIALDSEVKGHTSIAQYLNSSGKYVPHNVYIAGELHFHKGVMSKWNVRSGHYLPDEEFFSRGPVNWLNNIMPPHLFDY